MPECYRVEVPHLLLNCNRVAPTTPQQTQNSRETRFHQIFTCRRRPSDSSRAACNSGTRLLDESTHGTAEARANTVKRRPGDPVRHQPACYQAARGSLHTAATLLAAASFVKVAMVFGHRTVVVEVAVAASGMFLDGRRKTTEK